MSEIKMEPFCSNCQHWKEPVGNQPQVTCLNTEGIFKVKVMNANEYCPCHVFKIKIEK